MATEAQIIANRKNAQKSTGPRSLQGKAAVSQNAIKHGLSARRTIVMSENQEDFDRHRNKILDELSPQTTIGSMLIERAVNLSWRLKRTSTLQNLVFDALATPQPTTKLTKLQESLLGAAQPDPSESSPELALGRSVIKDFSNERVLERLLMYERRIENSLYKTVLEIQRLNLIKQLNPNI